MNGNQREKLGRIGCICVPIYDGKCMKKLKTEEIRLSVAPMMDWKYFF